MFTRQLVVVVWVTVSSSVAGLGRSGAPHASNPCARRCPPASCPPGWAPWRDWCYRFTDEPKPWVDAKAACTGLAGAGGEPAIMAGPRSREENDFFLARARQEDGMGDFFWLGCTDAATEGLWLCNGQQKATFQRWSVDEPNNVGEEDCAGLVLSREGEWMDYGCDAGFLALCRQRAPQTPHAYCFTVGKEGRLDPSCFED